MLHERFVAADTGRMYDRRWLTIAMTILTLVAPFALHAVPARATCASDEPLRASMLLSLPAGRRPPHGFSSPGESGLLAAALRTPAWLVARIAGIHVRPRGGDAAARLDRLDGRRVLQFPIGEPASGVFVRIAGRVEFERADIGFADGPVESIDAFGVGRGSGMYQLADFPSDRGVEWVRLVLRARSRQAKVRVLIER